MIEASVRAVFMGVARKGKVVQSQNDLLNCPLRSDEIVVVQDLPRVSRAQ